MVTTVEFTGLSGAGKTTLINAVKGVLADQGFLARDAYDVILARYGLNLAPYVTLRSLFIDLVAFFPFLRYISTRKGFELLVLAIRVISRDASGFLVALNLMRNFAKQIGVYVMLTGHPRQSGNCDFTVCDEGTLHIAHSLFVNSDPAPDPTEIVHFSNIVPTYEIIIWVKGTEEQSLECIVERGHPRVGNSTNAARSFVEHGKITFSVLCSQQSVEEKLFTVDNAFDNASDKSISIQHRAQTIAAFLKQYRMAREVNSQSSRLFAR